MVPVDEHDPQLPAVAQVIGECTLEACLGAADVAIDRRVVAEAEDEAVSIGEQATEIAEQYVEQWGKLAKETTCMVVPANLADLASMIRLAKISVQDG